MEKQIKNISRKRPKNTKRKLYRWHSNIGLIVLVPIIMWTISGLMHPFMAHWFRPDIPNKFLIPKPISEKDIALPLENALEQNNISALKQLRIVSFGNNSYYQIKTTKDNLLYLDTKDGKKLQNGDEIYAEHLARYFLQDQKSKIRSITVLEDYDTYYGVINRLLPVYRVSFVRNDNMDIYVETASSRLGGFANTQKKVFAWIFSMFHNWNFLAFAGTWRTTIQIIFSTIIFLSALSGIWIYGLMWKRYKKVKAKNGKLRLRKYHRQIGLAVAFVSFTFAFSGAYHAFKKYTPDTRNEFFANDTFKTQSLEANPLSFLSNIEAPVSNVSLVRMNNDLFYQYTITSREKKGQMAYINLNNGQVLENGDIKYANFLANKFSEKKQANIISTELITKFAGEYGFINKRLPVQKVMYNTPDKLTYYIETSTGKLSTKVTNSDRLEGFSFAFLHKYHGLDALGKNARDIVMSLAALGILVVSLFGLALYWKGK